RGGWNGDLHLPYRRLFARDPQSESGALELERVQAPAGDEFHEFLDLFEGQHRRSQSRSFAKRRVARLSSKRARPREASGLRAASSQWPWPSAESTNVRASPAMVNCRISPTE